MNKPVDAKQQKSSSPVPAPKFAMLDESELVFFKPAGVVLKRRDLMESLLVTRLSLELGIKLVPHFLDADPMVLSKSEVSLGVKTSFLLENSLGLFTTEPSPTTIETEPGEIKQRPLTKGPGEAEYQGTWYPGKITAINPDGTVDFAYDAGGEDTLPVSAIRLANTVETGAVSFALPAGEARFAADDNGIVTIDSVAGLSLEELSSPRLLDDPTFKIILNLRGESGEAVFSEAKLKTIGNALGDYANVTKFLIDIEKYTVVDPNNPPPLPNPASVADQSPVPEVGTTVGAMPTISVADRDAKINHRQKLIAWFVDTFAAIGTVKITIDINALQDNAETYAVLQQVASSQTEGLDLDVWLARSVKRVLENTMYPL